MNNVLQSVAAIEELQQQQEGVCNQCRALLAILDEGKIPNPSLAADFQQAVVCLREKEETFLASLAKHFPSLTAGTQTISAYRELWKQRESILKQVDFRGVLEKFCWIMSAEKSYDDAFAPFREEAAQLLRTPDDLTVVSEEKIIEFRDALDYLTAGDDKREPLLNRISSGIFTNSGIIVAGFATGKYHLSDSPGDLKDIEQTARDTAMTESMVEIISDINSNFSMPQFRNQMADEETEDSKKTELAGHMISILTCATWLHYFTARDLFRLGKFFFHDNIADGYQESDSASKLERLTQHGYLSSFRIPNDECVWYTLALNTRLAFTDGTIPKFIRKHRTGSPSAASEITGIIQKLSQVKTSEVRTTAEINRPFLDTLDYINDRFNSETVLENILYPLCRNNQCYYVEQNGIILLSSTIFEQMKELGDESSLFRFLQRKKEFRIIVADKDDVKALAQQFNDMIPCRLISLKEFGDELTEAVDPEDDTSRPLVSAGVINTDESIPKPNDNESNAQNLEAAPAVEKNPHIPENSNRVPLETHC
jgi:hypothetical protein